MINDGHDRVAASSGEGDCGPAPMARQEHEERCAGYPTHLERAGDMAGPLAQPNARRLTTSQTVCTIHTDEERGLDP